MIACDLHVHSIRSTCGYHTLLEIVSVMREKELKAFALTDHSPVHSTPYAHFSVMLRRMPRMISGLRVFKGIEATILNDEGDIDVPLIEGNPFEIVLAGLHEYGEFYGCRNRENNTRTVINVMKKHPSVKIISHPFYREFPLDLDAVTDVALETGTALEINNSYLLTGKADTEALENLLEHAVKKGTLLSVNSDGHMFTEMGQFDLAVDFMKPYSIGDTQIVNRTFASTLAFLGLEE